MSRIIGNTNGPHGSIIFSINGDKFEIQTTYRKFIVPDSAIESKDGKYIVDISQYALKDKEFEIPEFIIERLKQAREEQALLKNSVGILEHKSGKIYFSLDENGQLTAKLGEKKAIISKIETIETKRAGYVPGLDLGVPFIEIPAEAEEAHRKAEDERKRADLHLVYRGKSLLSGSEYYAPASEIDSHTFERVKQYFEWFGEPGEAGISGALSGWLTADPANVEEKLRITNSVESRKDEIEKQKAEIQKQQAKDLKKIFKGV